MVVMQVYLGVPYHSDTENIPRLGRFTSELIIARENETVTTGLLREGHRVHHVIRQTEVVLKNALV